MSGWGFNKSENIITSKVHHYRLGNKDYIVFKDKFKLYILDRRGKSKAKSKYNKLSKNDIVFVPGKSAHMLVTDISGSVFKVRFNGETKKMKVFKDISENHFFTSADIDNDGRSDYIFADKSRLYVYSADEKIVDVKFSGKIKTVPTIYSFSYTKKMIGVVDSSNSMVYLIDKKGKNYSGFPVSGNNPFSITFMRGKNTGFCMFVGSSDGSLYKYKVQE